jgi:hypothetical protein
MAETGGVRRVLRAFADLMSGDATLVRSTMEETYPDAAVFRLRDTPATVVALTLLGSDTFPGRRSAVALHQDRLEFWVNVGKPALTIPYARVESARPITAPTFVPEHGVELLVSGDGPSVALPLIPFDTGDPQGQDETDRLMAALKERASFPWT